MLLRTIVVLLLFSTATADTRSTECSSACKGALDEFLFGGSSPTADYYTISCNNVLRVQSTFVCMRQRCSDAEIESGLTSLNNNCQVYGAVELLPWSIIGNITDEQTLTWPRIEYEDMGNGITYNTSVLMSEPLFSLSLRTMVAWDDSLITRENYGYAMFGFFGIVILISMIHRAANFVANRQLRHGKKSLSSNYRTIRAATRKYLTLPALFTHRAAEPTIWGTTPPRLESLTMAAFIIINIILCCVRYDAFENNLYWSSPRLQIWRYVSDRTGVISMANMPLIWAFSMRNNVLMWLTGWSFSTFNCFHRWVARTATVEAIVHSFGYSAFAVINGGKAALYADWAEQYWWMGGIATVVMSFLCLFSFYPIRRHAYELFLLLHIAFAALFLASMYYHVEIFKGEYNGYIWPCVAVWCLDRVLRIGSLLSLNLPTLRATATYNRDADIVRLAVPVRNLIRPRPGTYYYIYFFRGFKFWESHPFTLNSWVSKEPGNQQKSHRELTFMLRPHDGFTARLRNYIRPKTDLDDSSSILKQSVRVAIEGPYGTPYDLSHYPTALFIIGGSGITVALSHLQALRERSSSNRRIHSIRLVWAVRDAELFQDVYQQELHEWTTQSSSTAQIDFRLDVHVTRSSRPVISSPALSDSKNQGISHITALNPKEVGIQEPGTPASSTSAEFTSETLPSGSENIHTSHHRPAIQDLVLGCAQEWCSGGESMAVVCCGPGSMVDDARAAVVNAVGRGYDEIAFHPEMFSW